MYDPLTVAHEIKNYFLPARKSGNFSYRRPLVTIWHRDPETDGTDDSCGWFAPKLTKDQQARLKDLAWHEARKPWFQAATTERIEDPVAAVVLMEGAIDAVVRSLRVTYSPARQKALCIRLVHNPSDNVRNSLAYKQGYHGNSADDDYWRQKHAMRLFGIIARNVLRDCRPWYRHPRWHVHHWELQIHPVQHFKRWAFSRCTKCGGRFGWSESPVGNWFGTGPRWFKSENVWHMSCDRGPQMAEAKQEVSVSR
jgi:hypothetical protein